MLGDWFRKEHSQDRKLRPPTRQASTRTLQVTPSSPSPEFRAASPASVPPAGPLTSGEDEPRSVPAQPHTKAASMTTDALEDATDPGMPPS